MAIVLLDTNIVSYIFNGHSLAELYRPHIEGRTTAISYMTVAELYEGACRRAWSEARVARLRDEISGYLLLQLNMAASMAWGRIRTERRARTISVDDAWIAAVAVAYDCPLVTHNPGDFTGISGLKLITEFGQQAGT